MIRAGRGEVNGTASRVRRAGIAGCRPVKGRGNAGSSYTGSCCSARMTGPRPGAGTGIRGRALSGSGNEGPSDRDERRESPDPGVPGAPPPPDAPHGARRRGGRAVRGLVKGRAGWTGAPSGWSRQGAGSVSGRFGRRPGVPVRSPADPASRCRMGRPVGGVRIHPPVRTADGNGPAPVPGSAGHGTAATDPREPSGFIRRSGSGAGVVRGAWVRGRVGRKGLPPRGRSPVRDQAGISGRSGSRRLPEPPRRPQPGLPRPACRC